MFWITHNDDSKLTSWYFEVDRRLLGCVLLLIALSAIFVVSAGSVAAERIGMPWHFYLFKAIPFYCIGLMFLFVSSFLDTKWVLRISAANLLFGLALLPLTVIAPDIINNSARFVDLGPFNVMPADIMKPGFIIMTAYFLARMKDRYGANIFFNRDAWRFDTWLSWIYYLALFGLTVFIIFNHPDFGTAVLYLLVFCSMVFIAGLPLILVPVFIGIGLLMLAVAFFTLGHVQRRIIAHFTGQGDTYQVDNSIDSIRHGGLLGSGDDAFVKQYLPDVHTDFIFAAIAIPTAFPIPWPRGPVVASTPSIPYSGCPGNPPILRNDSISPISYPANFSTEYNSALPCPADITNLSRPRRKKFAKTTVTTSAAPNTIPTCPLAAVRIAYSAHARTALAISFKSLDL